MKTARESVTLAVMVALSLALVGVGVFVARAVLLDRATYYTDGERIRLPARVTVPRRVLWQPAEPLSSTRSGAQDEYEPRVSADGTVMVFVRGRPGANADLYSRKWTVGGWSSEEPIAAVNTDADELGPELSRDGSTLYFYSDRAGGFGGYDLWSARRGDTGWEAPTNLGRAINTEFNEYGPAQTPDGLELLFASNRPRAGEAEPVRGAWTATVREARGRHDYDLYRSDLSPEGPKPAVPLLALNTSDDEGAPAISPAGDFVYFASDRPRGFGGFDLYRARQIHGVFLAVENLGPAINSTSDDLDPALSAEGFRLYFSTNRGQGERGGPSEPVPYELWGSASREVFTEVDESGARRALADAWRMVWPWVVILILAIFLGVLLAWLARSPVWRRRFGQLSLFAKCVVVSLAVHALLASAFAVWRVGSGIGDYLQHSGGTRVVLASSGVGTGLAVQIRGVAAAPSVEPVLPTGLERGHFAAPALDDPRVQTDGLPRLTMNDSGAVHDRFLEASPLRERVAQFPVSPHVPVPLTATSGTALPSESEPAPAVVEAARPAAPAGAVTGTPRAGLSQSPSQNDVRVRLAGPSLTTSDLSPATTGSEPEPARVRWPESSNRVELARAVEPPGPELSVGISLPAADLPAAREDASTTGGAGSDAGKPEFRPEVPMASRAGFSVEASPGDAGVRLAGPTLKASESKPLLPGSGPSAVAHRVPELASRIGPARLVEGTGSRSSMPISLPSVDGPAPRKEDRAEAGVGSASVASEFRAEIPRAARAEGGAWKGNGEASAPARAVLPGPRVGGQSVDSQPVVLSEPFEAIGPSERRAESVGAGATRVAVEPGVPGLTGLRLPVMEPEAPPAEDFAQRAPEVREEMLQKSGGSEETERAVGLALDWFRAHQDADGRWSGREFDHGCGACDGAAEIDADSAMTGIVLLCYLGAGHTHTAEGPYREQVRRGLAWLVSRQGTNGDLRDGGTMYGHTIATVALCEAFAMTRDGALEPATRRAASFLFEGSAKGSGLRDGTSVLGWEVMAMESARRAGIATPRTTFDSARKFLDTVSASGARGRYSYRRGEAPSAAMTAEAMFVQQLLGHSREEARMEESASFILGTPPRWKDGAPTYYWYYATLALFQQQGKAWELWNTALVSSCSPTSGRTGGRGGVGTRRTSGPSSEGGCTRPRSAR